MVRKCLLITLVVLLFTIGAVHGLDANRVSVFVSPDSSLEGLEGFLGTVDGFLYLSVYEIESPLVAEELVSLLLNGKNVTIIVEDMPAGGFSDDEAGILSYLALNGAQVYLAGDEYRFYHGKYAVSDNDTLFLTTENLGGNGFPRAGKRGNRGWGAVVEGEELAEEFQRVFAHDMARSRPFEIEAPEYNHSLSGRDYEADFELRSFVGDVYVEAVIAPDDAIEKIVDLIDSANKTLFVEQFYIYKYWGSRKTGSVETTPNPFLEAAIDAARRGVKVRILMDDTWYNVERDDPVSNYNTLLYINRIARKEGLDLNARLIDSEELGLEKLHTKCVVVDDRLVMVSSVNWNENSPTNNREVGVIIEGEPAKYYSAVFWHDWGEAESDKGSPLPVIIVVASLVLVLLFRRKT